MSDDPGGRSRPGSIYHRLLANRTFVLLWGGQTVSSVGDYLFNVAIMWVVYVRTGSALQSGVIAVIYTLSAVILAPIGGAFVDRWDRKRTMALSAFVSAVIVGVAAVPVAFGSFSPLLLYVTVFLLNAAGVVYGPARSSALPEIVGPDLMAAASGLLAMVDQGASLVGAALAGVVLAAAGATWALAGDAVSFLTATAGIAFARIPERAPRASSPVRSSLFRDLRDSWQTIQDQPVVRALLWTNALVNVASFMGPIFPALVRLQLHGGVKTYGFLEAAGVVGGMAGGLAAGDLERRIGAGRLLAGSFVVAGVCFAAMGISRSASLAGGLFVAANFFLIASEVSMGALRPLLVPAEYRGRVAGTTRAVAVIAMPPTIVLGGWLADRVGVGPLYVFGGLWVVGVGAFAASVPQLRRARIPPVASH